LGSGGYYIQVAVTRFHSIISNGLCCCLRPLFPLETGSRPAGDAGQRFRTLRPHRTPPQTS
jgi:hypothetical protein